MLYHCIHSCNAPSKYYWCVCSPRYRLRLHCNERRWSVFDTSDILLSLLKYLISFFECLTSRLGYQRCDFPLWYTDALNNEILKHDSWYLKLVNIFMAALAGRVSWEKKSSASEYQMFPNETGILQAAGMTHWCVASLKSGSICCVLCMMILITSSRVENETWKHDS